MSRHVVLSPVTRQLELFQLLTRASQARRAGAGTHLLLCLVLGPSSRLLFVCLSSSLSIRTFSPLHLCLQENERLTQRTRVTTTGPHYAHMASPSLTSGISTHYLSKRRRNHFERCIDNQRTASPNTGSSLRYQPSPFIIDVICLEDFVPNQF